MLHRLKNLVLVLALAVALLLPAARSWAETAPDATPQPTRLEIGGTASGSFEAVLKKQKVPPAVRDMVLRGFSLDPDFPKSLPKGSEFKIVYESFPPPLPDMDPRLVLHSAWVIEKGKLHDLFRYGWRGTSPVFMNQKGRSLRELSLRLPVDAARVTSTFGWREHPILKQKKFHYGLDLAAPAGSIVRAAADGVVVKAEWNGNYGNYIRIEHTPRLATGYAHLSAIVTTLKPGTKVKQGDMIGFVGMTGLATGPHLCFQLLEDGKQLNPVTARPMIDEAVYDQLASHPGRVLPIQTIGDLAQ